MKYLLLFIIGLTCLLPGAFSVDKDLQERWDAYYKEARKELRNRDLNVVMATLSQFSDYEVPEAAEVLISILSKSNIQVALKVTASDTLAKFKSEEVLKFIVEAAKKDSSPDPLFLSVVANMKADGVNDLLVRLVSSSRESEVVAIAIRGLGNNANQTPEVVDKVIAKLAVGNTLAIRKSALEALGGFNSNKAFPTVFELIGDKALTESAVDCLQRLTGQAIGNDRTAWETWYKKNRDFKPVNTDLKTFSAAKARQAAAEREKFMKESTSEFYDLVITGENILFILDRSGSMTAPVPDYGTRMDQLKAEFIQMLDGLNENTNMAVVMFPHATFPRAGLDQANDKFKEKMKDFISKVNAAGSTPTSEAMIYAFENLVQKKNVDTIYLLSDGAPNRPAEEVLKLIRGLNAGYYVQINTISIGGESDFLKKVAEENQGTYTSTAN